MEITYILNSRMPTEKARGVQTIRMCEAFSKQGCEVNFRYSNRVQNEELSGESIEDFYDLSEEINIESIPYLDVHPLFPYLGDLLIKPLLYFGNILFVLYCLYISTRDGPDYFMTRDWIVCVPFVYLGIPTIFSAHTVEATGFSPRARRAFSHISDNEALKLVVANSPGTADGMVELGVPEDKILMEPNGVDVDDYRPELSKREARQSVGLPQNEELLVYTGSLARSKGVYVLAEVSRYIDGKVVIVGGKEDYINELRSYVRDQELDDVVITGFIKPHQVHLYQFAADALALPPLEGNFDQRHQSEYTSPIKLFEYMAASRPIIASDIVALSGLLEDEENALFVEPGDPKSFAEAFDRVSHDTELREALVDACREKVNDHTWENRAESILEKIEERYPSG